jgi:hypothetical protein
VTKANHETFAELLEVAKADDGVLVEIDLNMRERSAFMQSVESVKGLVEACQKMAPNLGR